MTTADNLSEQKRYRLSLVGGVFGRGAQLGLVILLGGLLSTAEFAHYGATYATIFAIASIASGGVSLAVNRLVATTPESARTAIAAVVVISIIVSLTSLTVGSYLLAAITEVRFSENAELMAIAGLVTLNDGLLALMAGMRRVAALTIFELTRGVGAAVAGTLGALHGGWTGAMIGFGLAEALVVAGILLHLIGSGSLSRRSPTRFGQHYREFRAIAVPGLASALVVQVALWFAQVWVLRRGGVEAYATLVLSLRFANVIVMLPGFLTRNYLSFLTSSMSNTVEWLRALRIYASRTLRLAVAGAGLAVIAATAVSFLLGSTYENVRAVMPVLAIAMVGSAMGSSLGVALVARGARRMWVVSDLAFAGIFVTGVVLLSARIDPAWAYTLTAVVAYNVNFAMRIFPARRAM
jgi:O-antigen/teichoic acid export membrane protein